MSITVAAQPANNPPRVQISVSGLGSSTTTSIFRNDPDGRTRPVRSADPVTLVAGAANVFDYEAPFGQAVTYTSVPNANSRESSAALTLISSQTWLIHPSIPDLSVPIANVDLLGFEDRTRAARAAVQQPLGRATPIVVSDARASTQSAIRFRTDTIDQRNNVWALLDYGITLLLNAPDPVWAVPAEYISVGDASETAEARGLTTGRVWTMQYTVVDRPVGNVALQWLYSGILTKFGSNSYASVLAAYSSYTALFNQPV